MQRLNRSRAAMMARGRRLRGGLSRTRQPVQVVGSALRMGSGGEDGALVVLQDGKPVADIGGVIGTILKRQPEIGAKERRAQFGDIS